MAEFNLDLSSVVDELEEDIQETVVRRFALGVLVRCVRKSPVDTGRFRGGWVVSIDNPNSRTSERTDKSGALATSDGSIILNRFDLRTNTAIYIQNNLPYAERLENGYSSQAPNGVAGISLREEAEAFNSYKSD